MHSWVKLCMLKSCCTVGLNLSDKKRSRWINYLKFSMVIKNEIKSTISFEDWCTVLFSTNLRLQIYHGQECGDFSVLMIVPYCNLIGCRCHQDRDKRTRSVSTDNIGIQNDPIMWGRNINITAPIPEAVYNFTEMSPICVISVVSYNPILNVI